MILEKPDKEKELNTPSSENQSKALSSEVQSNKSEIPKPPKIEDKPFSEFINEHFIPELKNALKFQGVPIESLVLKKDKRPVVGGDCWVVFGQFPVGRRFWVTFSSDDIKSSKNISLAETRSEPALLESFLIDEKKITLKLLLSRLLQRLNGQKWLSDN